MTDLQAHVEAPGRADLVKQVSEKIKETGVDYIYYQFVSVTGRIVGKGIPAMHWERLAEKGFQLVYGSTANLYVDRHGEYIGYGPESSELVGIPDPETFCQLPWDKRVGRVFCTLFRVTKPNCYHIDQFEELRPTFMKVIEYSLQMGLDIIQGDHEDAPGQLELNTQFDDVLRNADRLTTYRQICAQVAREDNLIACFMSKPFMGVSASGCHHNMSLWRGGEDVVNNIGLDSLPGMDGAFTYRVGGENTYMPDPSIDERAPGPIGLYSIGGVIKHLGALTSIGSSTVNSYRRLWDTGFWAPIFADWGYQNRTCALRVSAPGRFEYRSVDSMVNPYLMGAALLKAFDDGIDNKLDPGEAEERNIYEAIDDGKVVKKLPMSLGEALEELRNDEVIRSSMPGEMYRVFEHYKRDEWERYNATVTDWDVETYLDCLP